MYISMVEKVLLAKEVPLLIVDDGIGKATLIQYIAKKSNKKVIELPLSVMDAEDFIGMVKEEGKDRFDFRLPKWFP